MAFNNWYIKVRTASGSRPLGLSSRISSKFFSMYSNTRYNRFFLHSHYEPKKCLPLESFFELYYVFLLEHPQHLNLAECRLLHYLILIGLLELLNCHYTCLAPSALTYLSGLLILRLVDDAIGALANDTHYLVLIHFYYTSN